MDVDYAELPAAASRSSGLLLRPVPPPLPPAPNPGFVFGASQDAVNLGIGCRQMVQAISLGVSGILRKTLPIETLIHCLTRVNEGEVWFEKALTESIVSARRYSLTPREGQLVGLLSHGLKNKEIATAKMLDIIQELESFSPTEGFKIAVVAYAKSYKKLVQLFKSFYKVQEAAGGLVRQQESGKILAIFRRGHWDMAKGKTEKNESIEQTAVREVQEETGIKNIDLQEFITTTYHTYNGQPLQFQQLSTQNLNVRRRMLKVSHWYQMETPDVLLVPQTEEDIEGIAWLDYADFLQKTPIFTNILDVLRLAKAKFTQDDEAAL